MQSHVIFNTRRFSTLTCLNYIYLLEIFTRSIDSFPEWIIQIYIITTRYSILQSFRQSIILLTLEILFLRMKKRRDAIPALNIVKHRIDLRIEISLERG